MMLNYYKGSYIYFYIICKCFSTLPFLKLTDHTYNEFKPFIEVQFVKKKTNRLHFGSMLPRSYKVCYFQHSTDKKYHSGADKQKGIKELSDTFLCIN